jgi:hypothetical protein
MPVAAQVQRPRFGTSRSDSRQKLVEQDLVAHLRPVLARKPHKLIRPACSGGRMCGEVLDDELLPDALLGAAAPGR